MPYEPQKANNVVKADGVSLDDLLVSYGRIQGTIAAQFVFRQLVNTNYTDEPVKGGTVFVRRMRSSISKPYGTARTNQEGDKAQNNGTDVKIDTDREISEEINGKDKRLYFEEGGAAYLKSRESDYAITIAEELEKAYFVALQQAAQANGLVNVSGASTTEDKISLLIQALEKIENQNVKGVDRSNMVLTLAPAWYDALEKHTQTLPNPLNGGVNARYFRRVEILPATRQGYDAVVQFRGSVAQPVVFDKFKIDEPDFSNDIYAFMSYYFGTKAVMPDLVLAAALDSGISA